MSGLRRDRRHGMRPRIQLPNLASGQRPRVVRSDIKGRAVEGAIHPDDHEEIIHVAAIQRRRRELGLTQTELARRVGRSVTTVHLWERGLRVPGRAIVARLARALRCSLAELSR